MSKKSPYIAVYGDIAHNRLVKRSAFTLIELLVVIAIIAILAAILFPVFAQAREKARQTTCASNQKQIGLAFTQYSQDFDETLPDVDIPGNPSTAGGPWDRLIRPYTSITVTAGNTGQNEAQAIARAAIFFCPSDFISRADPGDGRQYTPRSYQYVRARGCAGAIANTARGVAQPGIGGLPIARIGQPAGTLLMVELPSSSSTTQNQFAPSADRPSGGFPGCGSQDSGGAPTRYIGIGKTNHNGGWNYLFVDGHVKWHRPEQTVDTNPGDGLVGTKNGTAYGYWTVDDKD